MVGHTHNQIDQMFSRFSERLARFKAFTYNSLCEIIRESYQPQPDIILLNETYDFRKYVFSNPSLIIEKIRNVTFHHQYKIAFDNVCDIVPT